MFNVLSSAAATCMVNGQTVPCPDIGSAVAWGVGFVIGFGLVFVFCLVFWIMMLIHVLNHDVKDKTVWVIVIIFTGILGAIIYYFVVKRSFTRSGRHHDVSQSKDQ